MRRINKTPARNSLAAEVDTANGLARLFDGADKALGLNLEAIIEAEEIRRRGLHCLDAFIEASDTRDNGYAASLADFRASRRPGGET